MTSDPIQVLNRRTLREAATSMRELHPISHPRHEMWGLMASLCEVAANNGAGGMVLAVARSYLASVERPDLDGDIHVVFAAEHVGGCNGRCAGDSHYLIRGTT